MIYVFDTSSIRSLQHFYPSVFKTIWDGLDGLVQNKDLISTREVWNELERQNVSADVLDWAKNNRQIFTTPNAAELNFVAQILQIKHFQSLIGEQQRLKGTPVADPFVIACAKIAGGTVVTEEQFKINAAKIPNVCDHFNVPCIDLEEFMQQQGWAF
ncbi:MAG: PIN domain-containing protein [Pseudomonadota bacterium]